MRNKGRRLGEHNDASKRDCLTSHGGENDPPGHSVHPVPLARWAKREPADAPHARSTQQDSRVQSIRMPAETSGRTARLVAIVARVSSRSKRGQSLMHGYEFYVDPSRCIGCQSCVKACEECETHRGTSMINFDFIDRGGTTASAAYVCWHCEEPTCAMACPTEAIKKGDDGVVQSSLKPRCIGCSNCVLACPFGIPKIFPEYEQMMKCDMCYDRTSVGKRPMCATVCPSQALSYVRPEEIVGRREKPTNVFQFGNRKIVTRVHMMVPAETDSVSLDVLDYMWKESCVAFAQPQ